MKKLLSLLLIPLLLTSCNQNSEDEEPTLKIISPTGAPAVCFYNYSEDPNFETTGNATLLPQFMIQDSYDVVVAPTNSGINAMRQGANFKIGGTISFGNVFLVSTGLDEDNTINKGDSIVLFQKGAVPDKLFHYIFENELDETITYVKDVAVAAAAYQNKKVTTEEGFTKDVDYVLLAEPKVTALKKIIGSNKIYSIRDLFYEKSGLYPFQASIFISNRVSSEVGIKFLRQITEDIMKGIEDPSLIKTALEKSLDPTTIYGITPQLAYEVTNNNNGLGIGFLLSKDNKEGIDTFIKCFNMEALNEEDIFQ